MIHRFTTTEQIEPGVLADVEDVDYAALSLRMRLGAAGQPGAVFDELAARGQVHVHATEEALRSSVAAHAVDARRAGQSAAVSVATNDQAGQLNAAIRGRLVAAGDVDDVAVAVTGAGQRIGVGDLVVTRHNDRDVDVANRDTWSVTAVHDDGALTVTPTRGSGLAGERAVPAGYVNRHVDLGYAATVHGRATPPRPATWSWTSTPEPPPRTSG